MASRTRRDAQVAWLERMNPLQGLSIRSAQGIFDAARDGDTQRLHWLFQETEASNPVLLTCVERRAAAVSGFGWRVNARAVQDGALAEEQREAVETFLSDIENLGEALEHLDLAFFRGFAHAQPVWEADGTVREIFLPDSWRFLRRDGVWYYNPKCTGFGPDAVDCSDARLVTVVRRRPIDYPALSINIRSAIGERDWGRFLERHALPKPILTMHPGATNQQRDDYLEAALAIENGQVATIPSGASVTDFAGGSRGMDPFANFVEHQQKMIVLLATGGTLTSLAQADTGSLAGGAQMKVWEEIVGRDVAVLAAAVNRGLVRPFLEARFPGRPVCCDFAFDTEKKPSAQDVATVAQTLRAAGWRVDQAELEEAVGFTLAPDAPAQQPGGMGAPFLNKAPADGQAKNPVLEAFAKDSGPAADAVRALLEDPSPEAARDLLGRLPDLIPGDPALASVIAEEMASAFASAATPLQTRSSALQNAPRAEDVQRDPEDAPTRQNPVKIS